MLETLKGGVLWAIVLVILGVLGAATYLASQNILSGSDWLVLGTAILASVGIVTGAHVAGQAAIQAGISTVPAPAPSVAPEAAQPPVPTSGAISAISNLTEPPERVI